MTPDLPDARQTDPPVEVLYLAGTGRSGSTLLANLLDEVPGAFSAGELRFAWERGLRDGGYCGCGDPVPECVVWRKVVEHAFGSRADVDPSRVMAALASRTRLQHLPRILRDHRWRLDQIRPELDQVVAFYRATAEVTASQVIVDSSKLPTYALLLDQLPALRLRIVHLVRDPRATAFSWQREQASGAVAGFDEEMDRFSATKASALWSTWNTLTARLWADDPDRYLRVRYEELIADPEATLDRIRAFAGLAPFRWPRDDDGAFAMTPNHSIAGNPNRLRSGSIRLRPDDEWRLALGRRDRLVVDALTGVARRRLGPAS